MSTYQRIAFCERTAGKCPLHPVVDTEGSLSFQRSFSNLKRRLSLRDNSIHYSFVCRFRCFAAWHVLASTRVSNRRKVVLFGERRLLTMVIRIVINGDFYSAT